MNYYLKGVGAFNTACVYEREHAYDNWNLSVFLPTGQCCTTTGNPKRKPTFNQASLENSGGTQGYSLPWAQYPHSDQGCPHQHVPTEKIVTAQSPLHKTNSSSKSRQSPWAGPYPIALDLWILGNNLIIGRQGQRVPDVCDFVHSWTSIRSERAAPSRVMEHETYT